MLQKHILIIKNKILAVLKWRIYVLTKWPFFAVWRKLGLTKIKQFTVFFILCGKTFLFAPKFWHYSKWGKIKYCNVTCDYSLFLVARPFCLHQNFDPVTLTLTFDLILKKLNPGTNFWTERYRAFILRMDIPCSKTFLSVPKFLIL